MNMATTDSGTETLFSDDSPCRDLGRSPSICSGYEAEGFPQDVRLAPPNIQPYSGVLEKGKVVIRPIAFKPSTMSHSARFGLAGERYGSTPILTRPGSRLTLYGSSNDIHHQAYSMTNYSLDRKIRSSGTSMTSSSSPLATTSLSSLPHGNKLYSYDSLESVRKSPISNADSSLTNKPSYHLMISGSNDGSLMDLTPSPSDSGVSELEAALRDRDSELAYLRQTMEHNEQVIFRVYQEKEKVWERELKRLKNAQDSRLRTSAQKVLKLEQMLMMQTYQQQQEKKRLSGDAQRSNLQCDRLLQEVNSLRGRLEETEWGLCQKTGEISLLKTQLKELQNDHVHKCQELLQLRSDHREVRDLLEEKDVQIEQLKSSSCSKDEEILVLKEEIERLNSRGTEQYDSLDSVRKPYEDIDDTDTEIKGLRQKLSDASINDYSSVEPGYRGPFISQRDSLEDLEVQKLNLGSQDGFLEIERLRETLATKTQQFEEERLTWAQEKEKVLKYQRQLQLNYVQMFRRTRALESEIQKLSIELEFDKTGPEKNVDLSDMREL